MNNIKDQKNILIKNINTKNKLIPLNVLKNTVGDFKYFPADSKEWKNKIYFFNYNYMKNLFIYDLNIYKLIRNYFSMYLNKKLISSFFIYRKKKFLSLNKVYISKPEIKHINSRAIITIYVYNKEKLSNTNNIKDKRIKILLNILKKLIKKLETIFINKVDFNDKSTFLINLFLFKNVFKLKILKKLNLVLMNINLKAYSYLN